MSAIAAGASAWRHAYVERYTKGKVLSHLLGLVIGSQFLVSGAAHHSIPYVKLPFNTAWLDVPLRLLALWLILDRNWRIGRLRATAWEAIALGFPIVVGLAYPFVTAEGSIAADAEGYKAFLGDLLRFYTVFILVREAHLRAGFNGRITLTWIMIGLSGSACLAILQAFDVGNVRTWSETFFDQPRSLGKAESYRARGTAQHWNAFASIMVVAFLIATSALQWRRLKWWEWGFAALFLIGLGVSTSRGGYVTLFVTILAAGAFFLITRRRKLGMAILGGTVLSVMVFATVVVVAEVDRFRDLIVPPKVQSKDIGSLQYRLEQSRRLMRVGMQHPIFGTGPAERLYFNEHSTLYSVSSVPGEKDATYPLLFAQFGLVGIAYMLALVGFFVRFVSPRNARHPYALLAFCTGVALGVHSFSEMLLLSEVMYLVSVVAALAVTRMRPIPLPQPREQILSRLTTYA